MTFHTEYLIDEKGHKKGVVLSVEDFLKLLEYLEDLEDTLDIKKAKDSAKGYVDFKHVIAKLKKQKRIQ